MEQRAKFIDEGIDRVQEAWGSLEDEFGKLQKSFQKRRKDFEKETEKQVKKFEKSPVGKRITGFRDDAQKQIGSNFESMIGLLPVASRADLKRLERKVSQLGRKLTALEKAATRTAEKAATRTAEKVAAPTPAPETETQASA